MTSKELSIDGEHAKPIWSPEAADYAQIQIYNTLFEMFVLLMAPQRSSDLLLYYMLVSSFWDLEIFLLSSCWMSSLAITGYM